MSKENLNGKNPKSKNLSRRSFLGTTAAAAAAFTIIPRYVMGGVGYTAPSDLINVAGIGVGSQGGGDIQQICTPDVPIVRPQRNFNGSPLTKEQIAEREARMAEMMKRNPPPGGQANTNAVVQMGAADGRKQLSLQIFMLYVMSILTMQAIFSKDIPKQKYTATGVRCWKRRNRLMLS